MVPKHALTILWFAALLLVGACSIRPEPTASPDEMITIPAGWFLMGQDEGRSSNQPQRRIYLDAFAIGRTEVTNSDFAGYIAETGAQVPGWDARVLEDHADEPVVGVLWEEADAYCRWAGKRLPTEAEWEKAARGTDGRRYPWGDTWDPSRANTAEGGPGSVLPVGSFPAGASPYGALDLAGNVAEWVADYFDPTYYTYGPDHNPRGPSQVLDHGLRGGSWASPRTHAQTFFRDSSHCAQPNPRVGFRCAQTLSE